MRVFRPHADRARATGRPVLGPATGHEAMVTAPGLLVDVLLDPTGERAWQSVA